MAQIIHSALLSLIEQAGTSVAILTEGLARDELLRSRLTRLEVLRQLRARGERLPVIILTARDGVGDTVASLERSAIAERDGLVRRVEGGGREGHRDLIAHLGESRVGVVGGAKPGGVVGGVPLPGSLAGAGPLPT